MADDLDTSIKTNAEGPKKASGDSGSVEQHPLADQIAADKYLESKKASRVKGLGIKLAKSVTAKMAVFDQWIVDGKEAA